MDGGLIATIKSCIVSRPAGISLHDLNNDFRSLTGIDIPFRRHGHRYLPNFIESIEGLRVDAGIVRIHGTHTVRTENRVSNQRNDRNAMQDRRSLGIRMVPYSVQHREQDVNQYDERIAYRNEQEVPNINSGRESSHASSTSRHSIDSFMLENVYSERSQILTLTLWLSTLNQYYTSPPIQNYCNLICGKAAWNQILRRNRMRNFRMTTEFMFYNHQIIGDDCMHDLALRSLGASSRHYALNTCIPGNTIKKAQTAIVEFGCFENVLVFSGCLDAHIGMPLPMMIFEMTQLLLCVIFSHSKPVVCNLPPSPIRSVNKIIDAFNLWISTLKCFKLINLNSLFLNPHTGQIHYNMFERRPLSVECYPYFLWSTKGKNVVKNEIIRNLRE